jgi:hypothetical protein
MARRTTKIRRQGCWDTSEPPARWRWAARRVVPRRSQASWRGGARGSAIRRRERTGRLHRCLNEERQQTAAASRPPRTTTSPAAKGRGRDRSIPRENSLTESRDVPRTTVLPREGTPSASAPSAGCAGARSLTPGRDVRAATSRRVASVGIQRQAAARR